jgi:hypothetical protein
MVDSKDRDWRMLARQARDLADRSEPGAPERHLLIEIAARYLLLACMADEELIRREETVIIFPSGIV